MSDNTKCPACGYSLPAMTTVCDACGTEIRVNRASQTIEKIAERFQEIEAEVSSSGLTGKELQAEIHARKGRFIRDLPIPNSREDLLGLVHYIRPRIEDSVRPDPNADDWKAKFSEVMSLAKMAFKGDAKTRAEFEEIEKSLQITLSGALKTRAKRSPIIAGIVVVVLLIAAGGIASVQMEKRKVAQCEQKFDADATAEKSRLEGLLTEATEDLKNSKFREAQTTASSIHWDLHTDCKTEVANEFKMQWDQKRSSLEALIQKGEQQVQAQKQAEVQKVAAEEAAAASKAATAARRAATDKEF